MDTSISIHIEAKMEPTPATDMYNMENIEFYLYFVHLFKLVTSCNLQNCLDCMIPSRGNFVKDWRNSSNSQSRTLKSDSSLEVPGKTVARPPQKSRSVGHLIPESRR
jgi:hypothetical protein